MSRINPQIPPNITSQVTRLVNGGADSIRLLARALSEESRELRAVQAMAADDRPVEQQHRNIESVAPPQLRIRIDVEHLERRQLERAPERRKLREHLLAEAAVVALHEGELHRAPGVRTRPRAQCSGTSAGGTEGDALTGSAFTELAMNRTVSGGTSPTAVTGCPSTIVEKAEEVPTCALPEST